MTEEFNRDELIAPDWLDSEFFTKVLSHDEKDSGGIEVQSVKLSPGTGKNDHYASVMFRAVVEYRQNNKNKVKSLIVKTMPEYEGTKKDLLDESFIFETEIGMYTKILERFEKILRSVGDQTKLKADCLYHSIEPKKVLVFEDLVPLGYTVIRDRSLTMEEIKIIYLKLAKWYAVSYKLLEEDPSFFNGYHNSFATMPKLKDNDFIVGGAGTFAEFLETQPALREYKPYFESLKDDVLDKCAVLFQEYRDNPQTNVPYVLCHGDFHTKNLMFKLNPKSNECEDVMFLDFQLGHVGSIANDILYSFYMMLNTEQRANHIDELLQFLFTNLHATLNKIGFKGPLPQISDFYQERLKRKHYELFIFSTLFPMFTAICNGFDLEKLIESKEYRISALNIKSFVEELNVLLPKFKQMGFFED